MLLALFICSHEFNAHPALLPHCPHLSIFAQAPPQMWPALPLRYLKNSFFPFAFYYLYWDVLGLIILYFFIWGSKKDTIDHYCLFIRRGFILGRKWVFFPNIYLNNISVPFIGFFVKDANYSEVDHSVSISLFLFSAFIIISQLFILALILFSLFCILSCGFIIILSSISPYI